MKLAPVILEAYTDNWRTKYLSYERTLLELLGNVTVEHIGSTAIEGMVAKPEIDILVGINKLADAQKYIETLEKHGYVYFPKFEDYVPERRYLRLSDGIVPLVHIHMVEKDSQFYKEHIHFRDLLIGNPDLRYKYSTLKRDLAEKHGNDRIKYSEGKQEFIIKHTK